MIEFAKMRYNLLGQVEHWFRGANAAEVDDAVLARSLNKAPSPTAFRTSFERRTASCATPSERQSQS